MTYCTHCGSASREGAQFCENCGQRLMLPEPPRASTQQGVSASVAKVTVEPAAICAVCKAANPAGMKFCKMCGAALRAASGAVAVVAEAGTRLCPSCREPTSATHAFCQICGARLVAAGSPGAARAPAPAAVSTPAPAAVSTPAPTPAPTVFGRLVAVHRNGTDGEVFTLTGDSADLGRTEGDITFPDEVCLASRHAHLETRGVSVVVRPLDMVNGIYLRVKTSCPLASGDVVLLGREVLCFDLLSAEERGVTPLLQHGVALFASPPRPVWGRLRQVIVSGAIRDVFHLGKTDIVLGREEGDIRFPDDEFISRRHAAMSYRDGQVQLTDLSSSNGTYVRLRGERELAPGDFMRVGDRLLRFERG